MSENLFDPFPELATTHLILRKPLYGDASNISMLRSEPLNARFISRPKTMSLQDAEAWLHRNLKNIREQKVLLWILIDKMDLSFVGTICFWNFSDDKLEAEVGYELLPKYQGKGLMSEALDALISFATNHHLKKIEAYTQKGNVDSLKLLSRHRFILAEGKVDPDVPENLIFEYIVK